MYTFKCISGEKCLAIFVSLAKSLEAELKSWWHLVCASEIKLLRVKIITEMQTEKLITREILVVTLSCD